MLESLAVRSKTGGQRDLRSHPYTVKQAHTLQKSEQRIRQRSPNKLNGSSDACSSRLAPATWKPTRVDCSSAYERASGEVRQRCCAVSCVRAICLMQDSVLAPSGTSETSPDCPNRRGGTTLGGWAKAKAVVGG
jgi:hypothetical protein